MRGPWARGGRSRSESLEDLLWDLDPTDPALDGAFLDGATPHDTEPDHTDRVLAALLDGLTRWTLDLDDPYAWSDAALLG